jgi:uncharacterized protein YjbI with pentapeptide repeats
MHTCLLRATYLTGVHLMGVCLVNVHLIGVHLMGVHLIGVYLMGAHLIDVYFMDVYMFPNPKRPWRTSRSPTLQTVVDLSRSEFVKDEFLR